MSPIGFGEFSSGQQHLVNIQYENILYNFGSTKKKQCLTVTYMDLKIVKFEIL